MYMCVSRSSLLLAESHIDSRSIAKYGFFLFLFLLARVHDLKIDSTSLDAIVNS